MRLQFLQSIHLVKAPGHPAKDYKVGVHEVPAPVLKANHATIAKSIKAGWIVEGEKVKAVSLETPKERSLRLAERLGIDVSKEKAAIAKAKAALEPPADDESEEPSEESEEAPSEDSEPSDDSEDSEPLDEESEESESEEPSEESEEAPSEQETEAPKKSKKSKKRK